MGLRSEDRTIGETTYRVTTLGSKSGRLLLVRLVKFAGPAIGEIIRGIDEAGGKDGKKKPAEQDFDLGDVGLDAVAKTVETLAATISEADFAYLCDTLASRTEIVHPDGRVQNLAGILDNHFAGAYGELFSWIAFALAVNYGSFFSGSTGGALLAGLRKLKA